MVRELRSRMPGIRPKKKKKRGIVEVSSVFYFKLNFKIKLSFNFLSSRHS